MLRRMATVVAATTALALAGAAPALADHETPLVVSGNPDCEAAVEALEELADFDSPDLQSFGKVEFDDGDQPTTVDLADIEDEFDDFTGFDIFVIVKGGKEGANVYFMPPFHDLMTPTGQDISHVEVCGVPEEDDDNGDNGDNGDDNGDDNGKDDDDNGKDDDDNGKDDDKVTPKPAVPTSVPAGLGDSGSSSIAGTVGLLAVAAGMAAGIAVLVRRRFVEDN